MKLVNQRREKMIQLKIKDKIISQGFNQPDATVDILRIHYVAPIELDVKAEVNVSLCTSDKDVNGEGNGVVRETYNGNLAYDEPDYAKYTSDATHLIPFVCLKLGVELL